MKMFYVGWSAQIKQNQSGARNGAEEAFSLKLWPPTLLNQCTAQNRSAIEVGNQLILFTTVLNHPREATVSTEKCGKQ